MTTASDRREPVDILLADDNPNDIELSKRAFDKSEIPNNVHVVKDGIKVLQFLRQQARFTDAPEPDIILLDLEMPGQDGKEVMVQLQENPTWQLIPVIVFTSSDADRDILDAYKAGANAYLHKPVGYQEFQELVSQFEQFWFDAATLPPDS